MAIYLKYDGIDGEATHSDHSKWIDISSMQFGIGRATYDAAQEIRSRDITREEGVALAKRYDGEFPERFAEEIFAYLSIPEKEFPVASKQFEQPIMDRQYQLLVDPDRLAHLARTWSVFL